MVMHGAKEFMTYVSSFYQSFLLIFSVQHYALAFHLFDILLGMC